MQQAYQIISCSLATMLWCIQVIIYPAFPFISPEKFRAWHFRYILTITLLIVPLILSQAGLLTVISLRQASLNTVTQSVFILAAWVCTFTMAVPLHLRLQTNRNEEDLARVIRVNWLRTISWSIVAMLALWL